MDVTGYVALGRQTGLLRELRVVANNMANISTTGFRREGMIYAEHIVRAPGAPSVSMAHGTARAIDLTEGPLNPTGAPFDLAIRGPGFFRLGGEGGEFLTRAGNFTPDAAGQLVNPDGLRLLDAGGAPVVVPTGADIRIGADGTLSADGEPVARIGLWQPGTPEALRHAGGTLFTSDEPQPADGATLAQGFLEDSNVSPLGEVARMIEVQRAYDAGQALLDREDERIRAVIQTLGR